MKLLNICENGFEKTRFFQKKLLIGLLMIVLMAFSVNADISLSATSIAANAKPTGAFSTTFSVTNNETAAISGLSALLSTTELSGFNMSISPNTFDLAGSASQTVTVTGNVPDNVNTRSSPFSGTITVAGAGFSKTLNLDVTADLQLDLDKVKAKVDGKSNSLDPGDTIDDVKPGDKIEFTGDLENLFTDDDDIEIEDVNIEIIIEGIDDDDDLENDEDVGDIGADDKESFSLDFDIPNDVEDGDYDVTIIVEADDENGATHYIKWDLTLELAKEKHEIQIAKTSLTPSKISCSRKVNVNVDLKNQGRSDEDEVVVEIESSELEISFEDTSIPEIEEGANDDDSEYDKSYAFTISNDVSAGTYPIEIKVYYDTDTLSETKTVDLVVGNCKTAVTTPPTEEEEEVIVVTPPVVDDDEDIEIITTPLSETTEISLFSSNLYLLFLVGAIGIAGVVIIVLLVVFFIVKRRQ